MSASGVVTSPREKVKELDTMKESLSDIINQLQDIDPSRLSFSPFLDLDTQISLAPVSDSPESSVEELRSAPQSASGSQRSLEPPPITLQSKGFALTHQQPYSTLAVQVGADQLDPAPPNPTFSLDTDTENCHSPSTAAVQDDIPNGKETSRWRQESTNRESSVGEGRLLIGPERVELAVWSPEGGEEGRAASVEDPLGGPRCCSSCCRCCRSGRLPALVSALTSLLCAAGLFYVLYVYAPIRPPNCPDAARRLVFACCCCAVAALPIILALLLGAACRFCSGSFSLKDSLPSRHSAQQLFVTASVELLLLFGLNLVVMATLLPEEQLKLVPILVILFILGRLAFWLSLNVCSSWRGFGSGLTVFPLIAMVALNLFLMYSFNLKEPLFVSPDIVFNQFTPSP